MYNSYVKGGVHMLLNKFYKITGSINNLTKDNTSFFVIVTAYCMFILHYGVL